MQNWQAYRHNRRCKATNQWPNDPIVAENAAIIEEAEQFARDLRDSLHREMILATLTAPRVV